MICMDLGFVFGYIYLVCIVGYLFACAYVMFTAWHGVV